MANHLTPDTAILKILTSLKNRDFISFCDWIRTENKEGKSFSFMYDAWHWEQQQFQQHRSGKDIILKARQVGFSTLELIRDLFFALSVPNTTVVIIATDNKLAKDFLDRIKRFYKTLSELLDKLGAPNIFPSLSDKTNSLRNQRQEITLANGSTIKTLSAGSREENAKDTGRGNTIHRLHMSEVAFWKYPNDTITTLIGCLVPGAEVVIESTPNGIGDWFYNEIQSSQLGSSPYKFHFFPWYQHESYRMKVYEGESVFPQTDEEKKLFNSGKINKEQLKWYQGKRGELKSLSKLLTEFPIDVQSCFISSGNMFLTADMRGEIESKIIPCIKEEEMTYGQSFQPLMVYEDPIVNTPYILASDVSSGQGGDDSTIVIINADSGDVAATYANQWIDPISLSVLIANLAERYNSALAVVEENNWGLAVLAMLRDKGYGNLYTGEFSGKQLGWLTTTKSRELMFSWLYSSIQEKEISKVSRNVASQLYILARDSSGKLRAQGKTNNSVKREDSPKDDLAFAYGIAWYARKESFSNYYARNTGDSLLWSTPRDFGTGKISGFI